MGNTRLILFWMILSIKAVSFPVFRRFRIIPLLNIPLTSLRILAFILHPFSKSFPPWAPFSQKPAKSFPPWEGVFSKPMPYSFHEN